MLKVTNFSLRVAGRLLIENASFSVPSGAKVGFVGLNGSGKTSLFRAISGELTPESGGIEIAKGLTLGQVAQEVDISNAPLIDIVLSADKERAELLSEAEIAGDPMRIAEIQTRLADIDAHAAPARAAAILSGLGFNHSQQSLPVNSFSGGWRMRVALAAVLFSRPDILLLDEPTNYLDLEGVLWLETYVARYPGTAIVISHDRDLLNKVADTILHLGHRKITVYRGNYDGFERARAETLDLARKSAVKVEAQRKHMSAFVDRFRYKASKARQAQSRLKALERLAPPALAGQEASAGISFPAPKKQCASPIIRMESGNVGYEPGKPVLSELDFTIDADDRIALLGANGNGKSTLAKLIAGQLSAETGTLTRARNLSTAMFAQHQIEALDGKRTALDHVIALMPRENETKQRARVAQMGLGREKMTTAVDDLSGGEKARLMLGLATFEGPGLLILDEPTNHLDIDSRRSLIDALNDYQGAVILISHDRHLLEATVDRLWIVRNGTVSRHDGDLDSYRREILAPVKRALGPSTATADTRTSQAKKRKQAAQLRQQLAPMASEIKTLEQEIARLSATIERAERDLAKPGLFENDPQRGANLSQTRTAIIKQKAQAEEKWLALSASYEAALSKTG